MVIKSLHDISPDDLYASFSEAFKDYGRTWSKSEFEKMLFRRGYVPEMSFGAFDDNRLVSFTLNGIGEFNGRRTAYDTGTGTISEYRGRGLATSILEESLPHMRNAGIEQYLLEVIQTNTKAISIYEKAGFTKVRELNYFIKPADEIRVNSTDLPPGFQMKEIGIMEDQMSDMWDFHPSWQNHFAAIARKLSDFKILGVFHGDLLAGYGIIEPATGDIPQLAVHRSFRRRGIGKAILAALLEHNHAVMVRIINTDAQCDTMNKFLKSQQIPKSGAQFEMILDISGVTQKPDLMGSSRK